MQREFIIDGFIDSMVNLRNVLQFRGNGRDVILNQMIADAHIFCFQRCVLLFKEYMEDLVKDIEIPIEEEIEDDTIVEKRMRLIMGFFCVAELMSKEQFDKFGDLFVASTFFRFGRHEIISDGLGYYNEKVGDISEYFKLIDEFISSLAHVEQNISEEEYE